MKQPSYSIFDIRIQAQSNNQPNNQTTSQQNSKLSLFFDQSVYINTIIQTQVIRKHLQQTTKETMSAIPSNIFPGESSSSTSTANTQQQRQPIQGSSSTNTTTPSSVNNASNDQQQGSSSTAAGAAGNLRPSGITPTLQ